MAVLSSNATRILFGWFFITSTAACSALRRAIVRPKMNYDAADNIIVIDRTRLLAQLVYEQISSLSEFNTVLPPQYPGYTLVYVSIWPWSLQRVDQVEEYVQMHTHMTMSWRDDRLLLSVDKWKEKMMERYNATIINDDFNDAFERSQIVLPASSIWTPEIYIAENMHAGSEPLLRNVDVKVLPSTGNVELSGYFLDARSCQMSAREFPFDRQDCQMSLTARLNVSLQHLSIHDVNQVWQDVIDDQGLYESGEWQLFTSKDEVNQTINYPTANYYDNNFSESYLQYTYFLTRKSGQPFLNWILPPVLLTTAATISMFCGCSPGERYGFGATMSVTLAVMQASLREALSVSWDGYPILAQLHLGLMVGMIITTMASALPSWLASKPQILFFCCRNAVVYPSPRRRCDCVSEKNSNKLWIMNVICMAGCLVLDLLVLVYCAVQWMPALTRNS